MPGLGVVDLDHPGVGYRMTSLNSLKDVQQRHIAGTCRQAEAASVPALAGIFHADHRELIAHQNQWPFRIVNYMDLIGESVGLTRHDRFKELKLMQAADAIMAETRDLAEAYGLDPDEVRGVIANDMLADQHLPIDRTRHPN